MALIADRVELARPSAHDARIFGASPVGIAEDGALSGDVATRSK